LFEGIKALGADQCLAIDGEGRRGLHSQLPANISLFCDELGVLTGIKACIESLGIQLHISRKFLQVILAERTLILTTLVGEEVIVELPEFILIAGAFGGFS